MTNDKQPDMHPLSGTHINQGSFDAAADAYEAEYNAAHQPAAVEGAVVMLPEGWRNVLNGIWDADYTFGNHNTDLVRAVLESIATGLERLQVAHQKAAPAAWRAPDGFGDYMLSDISRGPDWEPLYTSQTTATKAAVAAAIRKAAEATYDFVFEMTGEPVGAIEALDKILASIPAEANAALEKICIEVAKQAAEFGCYPCDDDELLNQLRAIVTSVIEKGK